MCKQDRVSVTEHQAKTLHMTTPLQRLVKGRKSQSVGNDNARATQLVQTIEEDGMSFRLFLAALLEMAIERSRSLCDSSAAVGTNACAA